MLKFRLPNTWPDLLEIEDLAEYEGPLEPKKDEVLRSNSSGDDERYPSVELEFELCSGSTNYWATVNVWRDGTLLGQSEPFHEITSGKDVISIYDEDEEEWVEYEYEVELVEV